MITIENLTSMIKGTLKTLHFFNSDCKEINIKDVYLLNEDTLCCDFYPVSENSYDIKFEMAPILGCFNSFFRNNQYENINLKNYAIRAYDEDDIEILYALSSKAKAELIGKGGSIEWLTTVFFQENTADFRLGQAKQIISEIENGLREIVKIKLKDKFGNEWWETGIDNKTARDVKKIYLNNFGVDCTNGDILIDYTFIYQVKDIILSNYELFKSYFHSSSQFESLMDDFNKLRRGEAHNRSISNMDLENLRSLHEDLLADILLDLKSFQSLFLTENWKRKIKKIMIEGRPEAIHNETEISNEADVIQKLLNIQENLSSRISYLNDTITKLKSVVAPIHKNSVHSELISCFEKDLILWKTLLNETLTLDNEKISTIVNQIKSHEQQMDEFSAKFLLNEK
ncbi:hypothetical protein SAMN05421786_1011108 [Chryseobacterium ureilyticum]|uniref:Swt1-like HEPN domain-containing protein n=1 Tax=Chryseobacterium ureilyticum TaxID=373668 RepID=A0A1N7L926_9FLAO|nr:hypothetical protein [Chryseobacterium ureilyticum]SIS70307.1 hypothetical protein SAMN05421786_1011108 [Chryseobacterium ureilyticum]